MSTPRDWDLVVFGARFVTQQVTLPRADYALCSWSSKAEGSYWDSQKMASVRIECWLMRCVQLDNLPSVAAMLPSLRLRGRCLLMVGI